jgi:hypothetical protein
LLGEFAIRRQFRPGQIGLVILGEQMEEDRAVALPEKQDRTVTSGSSLVRPRDALLDQKHADLRIDQPAFGPLYCRLEARIPNALLARKAAKFPGLVNLHFRNANSYDGKSACEWNWHCNDDRNI